MGKDQKMRSMTAIGRAKKNYGDVEIVIDIQSVNRKHFDVQFKMSQECLPFEPALRQILSDQIARGQITVVLQVIFLTSYPAKVHVNSVYAKSLHQAAILLAKEIGAPEIMPSELVLQLMKERNVLQITYEQDDAEELQKRLEETLRVACKELTSRKELEGKLILQEFQKRLTTLEEIRQKITERAMIAPEKYKKRLQELLKEFTQGVQDQEDRIAKECALMAEKIDISEELSRLGFHIAHFREVQEGKVLEFILQEMQREVNTIGSKSQDAQISRSVIEAKSEIEKMREQVQNVE